MKRVQGTADIALIECVNPKRKRYRIRWDVQTDEEGVNYMEEQFDHEPTADEIKSTIIGWYNEQTDEAILSGFTYGDTAVWLSTENQFNYKAAYDLAVQTAGATLPVTFKFGTDEAPVYKTFETLEELSDFYTKAMAYVQTTLSDGWTAKDNISWADYGIE